MIDNNDGIDTDKELSIWSGLEDDPDMYQVTNYSRDIQLLYDKSN